MNEAAFKKRVTHDLKGIPHCYFFTKEAKAIKGLPDIICCIKGIFVGLELKRSLAEAKKKNGRIVLQRYTITKIRDAMGYGAIVYPENWDQCFKELTQL